MTQVTGKDVDVDVTVLVGRRMHTYPHLFGRLAKTSRDLFGDKDGVTQAEKDPDIKATPHSPRKGALAGEWTYHCSTRG
jgi:hypothetical protein